MARPRKAFVSTFGSERPLSFAQLAALLAILMVGVLTLPVGVQAIGQLATIVDADSDIDAAQVDSGSLRVGDGSGALTVDGTVTANTPLGTSFVANSVSSGGTARIAGPLSSTTRFAFGSLTIYGATSTATVLLDIRNPVSGSCSSSGTILISRAVARVTSGQVLHLPYPLPLTFGSSGTWCLYARSIGSGFTLFHVGRTVT